MRKIGFFAVALIACLLAVSPVSAAVIVDEKLNDWADTSGSGTITGGGSTGGLYENGYVSSFVILDITKMSTLNYIVIDYSGNGLLPEGRTQINYTFNGLKRPGAIDTVKSKNLLGSVTKTRYTIWLYDWSVGTLTGSQTVSLGENLWENHPGRTSYSNPDGSNIILNGGIWGYPYPSNTYTVTYSSGILWQNSLQVEEMYDSSYKITLLRVFSEKGYYSGLKTLNSIGTETYSNDGSTDVTTYALKKDAASINVVSPTKTYGFPLAAETPETPIDQAKFSLSLSPDTGSVGSPITATISPAADAPRYSEISWTWTDPDGNMDIEIYQKSSSDWTTWTHYNKTAFQFESTTANPHTLTFSPASAGSWTVQAIVRDIEPPASGAALADLSKSCEVERAAGNVDVVVSVFDGAKSSASYLAGVGVTVRDLTRDTVIYDSTGEYIPGASGTTNDRATLTAPLGDQIQITAKKTGYITHTETDFVQPTALPLNQMPISITLMPAATPAPDKAYLTVLVTDLRSQPIEGASVLVAGSGGVTGSQGTCRITVPTNETLSYSISAQGYHSVSGYVMDGITENTQITVELYSSAPVTPTVTPTPGGSGPDSGTYAPGDESQIVGDGLSIFLQYYQLIAVLCFLCLITGLTNLMGGKRR